MNENEWKFLEILWNNGELKNSFYSEAEKIHEKFLNWFIWSSFQEEETEVNIKKLSNYKNKYKKIMYLIEHHFQILPEAFNSIYEDIWVKNLTKELNNMFKMSNIDIKLRREDLEKVYDKYKNINLNQMDLI